MATKIVIFDPLGLDDASIDAIRKSAPEAKVVMPEKEQLADELLDAEIFYGFHTPEVFRGATELRWIQTTAAGLEQVLEPELVARDLKVTNASGVHAGPVAEMAWALTLAVARGLPTYFRQQQDRSEEHTSELQSH